MAAFAGLAFTTTVRVIDRVHDHTANGRTNTAPAHRTSFTDLAQAVLFVGDFANRGAAFDVDLANFARPHANLGVGAFARQQRRGGTSGARNLRTLARLQLDAVDRRADRNVPDRQGVASADRGLRTTQQRCTSLEATRRTSPERRRT